MEDAQIVNFFGALALSMVSDIERATGQSSQLSGSDRAALIVVAQQPGLSIDQLRLILLLSHSGCVRLVDRLVALGFVLREAGIDGRTVSLKAAQLGLDEAARILSSRLTLLKDRLNSLSPNEFDQLGKIASKLLIDCASTVTEVQRVCRLCDHSVCFRRGQCPVASGLEATTARLAR